jgi:hypothetical protein
MSSTIEVLDSSSESENESDVKITEEIECEEENTVQNSDDDSDDDTNDSDEIDENGFFQFLGNGGMSTEDICKTITNIMKDDESGDTAGTSLANIARELNKFNHNFKKYLHIISKP